VTDFEERFAEGLARTVNRRRFLRKTSQVAFVGLSGVVAGGLFTRAAGGHTLNGQAHCANNSGDTYCEFPNGQSCGVGCNGHACPSGYYWTNQWGYASACWCSNVHGTSYSICCDCSQHQNATQTYPTDCGCSSEVRIL
jgi:hypothetical protein